MTLHDEIVALEALLLDPAVRASQDAMDRLVADQFLELGNSGNTYSKQDVIAQALAKPDVTVDATDFRVLAVSPDVALVTYRTPQSLRSSIWRREGVSWRIFFHQGTPTNPAL
jgi:hypothetical protein